MKRKQKGNKAPGRGKSNFKGVKHGRAMEWIGSRSSGIKRTCRQDWIPSFSEEEKGCFWVFGPNICWVVGGGGGTSDQGG